MNILRVITSMNPENGGPCQGIRNSIPALQQIDIYNEVVCFDSPDAPFLGKDNFVINAIGPAKGPYAYCPQLHQWLLDNFNRFDAVIIHGLWQYNGYGTFAAWKKYKKNNNKVPNLYVMPHGMLDPYFQKAKERRVKAIRNWLFWKLFEKKVVNKATGVLFTCQEELLLARQPFNPYKPQRELNIGYGIPKPPEFTNEMQLDFIKTCPEVDGKPYLLFLSRIHHKKGVDILIKAYLELRQEYNLPALVIAGPVDTPYGQEMKELAADSQDIFFPGMLSGNAKWGAFYGSEGFILPSHQENFGIAVVEAMASKKPVIISEQVNIWREIKEGNAGIVIADNQDGVVSGLQQWAILNSDEKIAMGNNAYSTFKSHFSVEQAAVNIKDTFQNIANGK